MASDEVCGLIQDGRTGRRSPQRQTGTCGYDMPTLKASLIETRNLTILQSSEAWLLLAILYNPNYYDVAI